MDRAALIRMWHDLDVPEGLRAELLDGELVLQPGPGCSHDLPGRTFVRHTPEPFEAWSARGVRVADDYRRRADAVVTRAEDLPADNEADWPAQIIQAVIETVSTTRTAIRRDWEDKRERYAEAGIPVHLIVDPNDATWHLLQMDGRHYVETAKGIFGQEIPMPEPMGSTVRTAGWHPYGGTSAQRHGGGAPPPGGGAPPPGGPGPLRHVVGPTPRRRSDRGRWSGRLR
ncbi:Uma2 family endonuclease [Streptomyces sp. NPDC053560]|uniref:Uma2 family endonuclease n=1 Tax=Streptomyces sp. NPDC053560 TaxID=3365711 RepID=UPI0037D47D55